MAERYPRWRQPESSERCRSRPLRARLALKSCGMACLPSGAPPSWGDASMHIAIVSGQAILTTNNLLHTRLILSKMRRDEFSLALTGLPPYQTVGAEYGLARESTVR